MPSRTPAAHPLLAPLSCTLRQLQYIVAVAELGGFRRAAEACHVSQPSLSAQVAQAEGALGVQIFERAAGRVRIAPGAQPLVDQARAILASARDLADKAGHLADPFSGSMRIGVIPTVCPYLLPDVAPALAKRFPNLTVFWTEDKTHALVEQLEAAQLDAVLAAAGDEVAHLQQSTLVEDPFVLAAAPGEAIVGRGSPARPDELRGKQVLLLEDGHCFRDQALALCAASGATEVGFRATSLATLVQMVSARAGITLLPSLALPVENRKAQLQVRRFRRGGPSRTLVLVWRRGAALASAIEAVAGVIRNTLKDSPRG